VGVNRSMCRVAASGAARVRDYDTDAPQTHPLSAMTVAHSQTDHDPSEPDTTDPFLERPSKTRRKQASHDLQDLGEAVVALPDARIEGLAIAESLLDAIRQYKKTKTFEGQRRQMQYIGKLMRIHDVEPIRQAVTDMQLGRAKDSLALHQAERWRAELLADDSAATRWITEHPQADVQQLRSLVRAARKDAALVPEKRSGRAFRELFQFIKAESNDEHV
jgi:ribosome-associated protein